MNINLLDRIGDWNPQLLREIKGCFKVRNLAIAIGSSLLGQLLFLTYWLGQQPHEPYSKNLPYCKLHEAYNAYMRQENQLQNQYRQLQSQFNLYSSPSHFDAAKVQELKGSIENIKAKIQLTNGLLQENLCPPDAINIQLWWNDQYPKIFASLSIFVVFILLVIGTYMLINNLAGEERRGTLNFIRLSPQSTVGILSGKLLGVPILLYLAAILTLPLHLWLGLSAQIPFGELISFYAVIIASCAFFYSAALLFGLVTPWLGGFQAWLGGGAVFIGLMMVNFKRMEFNPLDWLNMFTPSIVLPYLVNRAGTDYTGGEFPFEHGVIQELTWFHFPIGATGISLVIFVLLNYALWTGWIWQALNRRFHNPSSTIFSKAQSYWLVACFEAINLGFSFGDPKGYYVDSGYHNDTSPWLLAGYNLVLFLVLIAVLSPQRQALQDWARYRKEKVRTREGAWKRTLVQDLISGEKSPALVAIAINLMIGITPFLVWISLWPGDVNKAEALLAVAFFVSLIMIYATVAQIILMMKNNKRSLWAVGTVSALLILPPMTLGILGIEPDENATLFLFSTFPWGAIEYASTTTVFMALLGEWSVLLLLNLQLTRQLRLAGESATKALLANRSA
jgi:hypothetical protein